MDARPDSSENRPDRETHNLNDAATPDAATKDYFKIIETLGTSDLASHILQDASQFSEAPSDNPKAPAGVDYLALLCAALVVGRRSPEGRYSPKWLYSWFLEQSSREKLEDFLSSRANQTRTLPAIVLPTATAVLERARSIAEKTEVRKSFSSRHLIAALTIGIEPEIRDTLRRQTGVDISGFRSHLLNYIAEQRPGELTLWQPVLAASEAGRSASDFTADAVNSLGIDPLGIGRDVTAFAELICLEQATPPLSICLFGAWGSGKSTFMEALQREIRDLISREREHAKQQSTAQSVADDPRFVDNIVQIKFNAWHYADADLWASLTAVFFDQLRRGGCDGDQSADYQALIGNVAERVRSLEANAQLAEKQLDEAKHSSEAAHKALDSAERKLAASDLELTSDLLQKQLDQLRKEDSKKLKTLGRNLDREDIATDAKSFQVAVLEASTIPGKIALIARVLAGGRLSTYLAMTAIVAVALFSFTDITSGYLYPWAEKLIGCLGGLGFGFAALRQALSIAEPVLNGAFKYAKAAEEAREKLTKEVEEKRKTTIETADKLAQAARDLANARAPLLEYGKGVTADAPATILRYFLFEDTDIRDYDKHVGIISRARRSFEQLDAIVKSAKNVQRDGIPIAQVPDRIVLYIDDLDRCTHDQVYAVLQAIHLLLAFELFVVVVGVDLKWIEGAVAKHFEGDAARGIDPAAIDPTDVEMRRRKHAIDYLEKIFQIPFWLRNLSVGDEDMQEATGTTQIDGTYQAYVRELLKKNMEPGPLPRRRAEQLPTPGQVSVPGTAQRSEPLLPPPPVAPPALTAMRLKKEEIEFLADREIGKIAGKSPRAVKRLINVYRLLRAGMSGLELDEFLGETHQRPLYPIAVLLTAIEGSLPAEVADEFRNELASLDPGRSLTEVWLWRIDDDHKEAASNSGIKADMNLAEVSSRDEDSRRKKAEAGLKDLGPAIKRVAELTGPRGGTVGEYLHMARTVRRYSFNRYY
ncbi:MAG TPA: P-loop NTPase fold protein [Xanthobacteraceae bacterium]|jgi:hypothetical protein|nr:P-loop NTPase fold protein [Xanthobacteraceae bacterium]